MKQCFFLKSLLIILALSMGYSLVKAHGFSFDTYIRTGKQTGFYILGQQAQLTAKGKHPHITSYDTNTHSLVHKNIVNACYSTINSYCTITFTERSALPITCSPTQLLYAVNQNAWKLVCDLRPGDYVLAEHDELEIKDIQLHKKTITLVTIEVADTHTYLVGNYGVIAHNVVLPVAATIGFAVPLSIGEGGALGIAFGPPGIIGGIIIGGIIGFAIDAYRNGHLKKCRLTLDLNELDRRMHYANETPVVELPVQAPEITIPEKKQEGVDSQPDQPKAENPEGKIKTVEEIVGEAKKIEAKSTQVKQFAKPGGFPEAIKDFESLKPSNVREIKNGNTGFIGDLPDGRTVNVRLGSSDKRPTLEIQNKSRTKYTKIRYGNK